MNRIYYIIILFFSTFLVLGQGSSGGLYELSFTGKEKPDNIEELLGRNAPTGAKRYTDKGIVLTNSRQSISGFIVDDLEISLASKATFEFDYALATANEPGYNKGGGLAFILFDAAAVKPTVGYGYSAFGYSVSTTVSTPGALGFSGGYFAIGLDNYSERTPNKGGGFHGQGVLQQYELREGIGPRDYAPFTAEQGIKNNNFIYSVGHITIRGGTIPGSASRGNSVLLTKYFGGYPVKEEYLTMAQLNYSTGDYIFDHNSKGNLIDIADGGAPEAPNFQRIIVDVAPDINLESGKQEGTYISVSTLINGEKVILIDQFQYKNKYKAYTYDFNGQSTQYDYSQPVPEKVKIAFTATTGDFTLQTAIIGNLKVSSSDFISVPDVTWQMCVSQSGNSIGANSSAVLFEDSDLDLNKENFYFLDSSGNNKGQSYDQPDLGTWQYDPEDSVVTLTISNNQVKPNQVLGVNYVITDMDGKSSQAAELRVSTIACGGKINPQIESKAIEK